MIHNSTQVTNMSGNSTTADTRSFTNHDMTDFVIHLLFLPILSVFGIIGNILSIVVLGRDDVMKKTTRLLLQNLAVADIGFLIMFVFMKIFKTMYNIPYYSSSQIEHLVWNMGPYIWPIVNVFHLATIYLVVIVTGDRYIAICRPLQSGTLSTTRNARWAVAVVWLMAVIFNIPRWFDYMRIPCTNGTSECYSSYTLLGHNSVYIIVYKIILVTTVRIILPLIALIIFNVKLIMVIRASCERHSNTQQQNNNTTVMLVTIVMVFMICFTPAILKCATWISLYVFRTDITDQTMARLRLVDRYIAISDDTFLVVNSTVNFLIYLAGGDRFRKILQNMCHPTKAS